MTIEKKSNTKLSIDYKEKTRQQTLPIKLDKNMMEKLKFCEIFKYSRISQI